MKESINLKDMVVHSRFMDILVKEFQMILSYDSERVFKQHGIKEITSYTNPDNFTDMVDIEYMTFEEREKANETVSTLYIS